MADKKKIPLSEITFKDISHDALIEHAVSLGGKDAKEALLYLQELSIKVPFTDEMKDAERDKLKEKTKRKKIQVKKTDEYGNEITEHEFVGTGKRLYTDAQIEEILNDEKRQTVPKHDIFTIKRLYCEKYWKEIVPKKKKTDEPSFEDKIEAALADL